MSSKTPYISIFYFAFAFSPIAHQLLEGSDSVSFTAASLAVPRTVIGPTLLMPPKQTSKTTIECLIAKQWLRPVAESKELDSLMSNTCKKMLKSSKKKDEGGGGGKGRV